MFTPTRPYSQEFNEHYWSGGAAEKSHVFLAGNNLPQRFAKASAFTVAELGFGTALNFCSPSTSGTPPRLPTPT